MEKNFSSQGHSGPKSKRNRTLILALPWDSLGRVRILTRFFVHTLRWRYDATKENRVLFAALRSIPWNFDQNSTKNQVLLSVSWINSWNTVRTFWKWYWIASHGHYNPCNVARENLTTVWGKTQLFSRRAILGPKSKGFSTPFLALPWDNLGHIGILCQFFACNSVSVIRWSQTKLESLCSFLLVFVEFKPKF